MNWWEFEKMKKSYKSQKKIFIKKNKMNLMICYLEYARWPHVTWIPIEIVEGVLNSKVKRKAPTWAGWGVGRNKFVQEPSGTILIGTEWEIAT